jgi:hypothetical protein
VIGALALAGCGGSDDPEPAVGDSATQDQPTASDTDSDADTEADTTAGFAVDACSLLTADEVAAATGANAEQGEPNVDLSSEAQSICEWVTDASGVAFVQVVVSDSDAQTERQIAEDFLGPAQDADVPGTSNAYVTAGLAGAQDGPYFVQVTVVPDDDDAAVQLLGLAAAALD